MRKLDLGKYSHFVLGSTIAITLVASSGYLTRAEDPSAPPKRETKGSLSFKTPEPPDDIGEPGSRVAAGTRGGCDNVSKELAESKEKPLTALVPAYGSSHSDLVLGLTAATHPTFWFFVPYFGSVPAKFFLQESDKTVYQTSVSLSGTPGVVKVSLPSTVAPLKIGQPYHWFLNVYCHAEQPPAYVHGWVERASLNPTLKSRLQRATLKQRVALFAANGIWYDALTNSAELRYIDPKDANWVALLQSVYLNEFAYEPIVAVTKKSKPVAYQNIRHPAY